MVDSFTVVFSGLKLSCGEVQLGLCWLLPAD